jgi:hypothetical protein
MCDDKRIPDPPYYPPVRVTSRVPWWRCGAVWVDVLNSWTGYGFRACWYANGLPPCTRRRGHRGEHQRLEGKTDV